MILPEPPVIRRFADSPIDDHLVVVDEYREVIFVEFREENGPPRPRTVRQF